MQCTGRMRAGIFMQARSACWHMSTRAAMELLAQQSCLALDAALKGILHLRLSVRPRAAQARGVT